MMVKFLQAGLHNRLQEFEQQQMGINDAATGDAKQL
jgi:hypothetical protein